MKNSIRLLLLGSLFVLFVNKSMNAQIQYAVRGGVSTATGIIGGEIRKGHLSVFGGYFDKAPQPNSTVGYFYNTKSDKVQVTFGINYYYKPSAGSFYTGINIVTNAGYEAVVDYNTGNYVTEYCHGYYLHAGYRFAFLKYLDFKLGGGFGVGKFDAGPGIDISLGINFPQHEK